MDRYNYIWGKVFKSGISKFFKGYLPQNLLSPVLNTLSHIKYSNMILDLLPFKFQKLKISESQ